MNEETHPGTEQPEQKQSEQEAEQLLPDGQGLTVEQVRGLLFKYHDTKVSKDDPVLMLVTLFNAFLAELGKTQERHAQGMGKLLSDKTDGYVKGVKGVTDSLAQSLSDSSVQGIRKVFDDHAARLHTFRKNVTWTAAIVAVSALVNVTAFVLLAVQARI